MNNFIRIVLGIMFLSCGREASFTVTGDVEGLDDVMVYFELGARQVDSVKAVGGHFEYKGNTLEAPEYITVRSGNNQWGGRFWAENSRIKITGSATGSCEITGSRTEDEYQLYREHMKPVWMAKEAANSMEDSVFMEFARRYPRSQVSLNHVYNCRLLHKYSFPRLNVLFQCLDTTAFKGRQWNTFMEVYNIDRKLQPGCTFPAFSFPDVFDTSLSLADYKGRYLLVTIGSAGLDEYENGLLSRKELYDQYADKGFTMMDILLERNKEKMIKVIANYGIKWDLVSDCKYWDCYNVREWGIDHICQNFLLDREGKIIARNLSLGDLKKTMNDLK